MDYLARLAGFACGIRLADLPASTIKASKLVLLDTIGAIVAGSALPENVRLARMAARNEHCELKSLQSPSPGEVS